MSFFLLLFLLLFYRSLFHILIVLVFPHFSQVAVSWDGKTIHLNDTLQFKHVSENYQIGTWNYSLAAEVGLLTRNIVIEGADDAKGVLEKQSYGCRVLIGSLGSSELLHRRRVRIENVEFRNCGQEGLSDYDDPRYLSMWCGVVRCVVLYRAMLRCDVLYYAVLYWECTVLYCIVLYCTALHCTALYCTVLCCAVLCCTVLYCTVLYCTVLCCAVLCCAVLCCAVLYCTILYCTALCCAMLCCIGLCCFVLCCVALRCIIKMFHTILLL